MKTIIIKDMLNDQETYQKQKTLQICIIQTKISTYSRDWLPTTNSKETCYK